MLRTGGSSHAGQAAPPHRNIQSYTIPAGTTTIGQSAFYRASKLTGITIPEGVTTIGMMGFDGCSGLTNVILPTSLRTMNSFSFGECTGLTEITIREGLTYIQSGTFTGCRNLVCVRLPKSVTSIAASTFDSTCQSLSTVYYSGSETEWSAISIGSSNDKLLNATVYFDSVQVGIPTNIHWADGSLATAVWDAVDGVDYYQLEVYVYDEPASNLIGTYITGTADTAVDIQQEIHTIIGNDKDNVVQVAYRVASGTRGEGETEYTFSDYSVFAPLIAYDPAITTPLAEPEISITEEGLLAIHTVEHADGYSYRITFHFDNQVDPLIPPATELVELVNGAIGADQAIDGVIQIQFDMTSLREQFSLYTNAYDSNVYVMAVSNNPLYQDSDYSQCPIDLVTTFPEDPEPLSPPEISVSENGLLTIHTVEHADGYRYRITFYFSNQTDPLIPPSIDLVELENGEIGADQAIDGIIHIQFDMTSLREQFSWYTNAYDSNIYVMAVSNDPLYQNSDYSQCPIDLVTTIPEEPEPLPPPEISVTEDGLLTIHTVEHADGYSYRITFHFDNQVDPLIPPATELVELENGVIGADQAIDGIIRIQFDMDSLNEQFSSYANAYDSNVYVMAVSNSELYQDSDYSQCSIKLKVIGALESIHLSPEHPILYLGKSLILGKTIVPDDVMYTTINWGTSDAGIVTVSDSGMMTGVAPGTATVSASIDDVYDTVEVTVYTISSNIENEDDQQQAIDTAGDIIDDIANNDSPDLSNTDISENDLPAIREEVQETIADGGSVNVDVHIEAKPKTSSLTWYDIIQRVYHVDDVDSFLNVTFDMYVKDKSGDDHHIGSITEFEEPMTVELPAPVTQPRPGYARQYEVIRIHGEEVESLGEPVYDNGTYYCESDKFSVFALAYRDTPLYEGMTTLTLPSALTIIGSEAFAGTGAQVIIIPENCEQVADDAFNGCSELVYIVNRSNAIITAPEGVMVVDE